MIDGSLSHSLKPWSCGMWSWCRDSLCANIRLEVKKTWIRYYHAQRVRIKVLGSECQTRGTYTKRAKQATKTRRRRGLLVSSKLPGLSSASSRPGCFHTSPGCKSRSLIRFFLDFFDLKKCEEGRSNSGLFASKRSSWSPSGAKSTSTDSLN
jgi:hypothetical protein